VKRWAALLITGSLIFSSAACDREQEPASSNQPNAAQQRPAPPPSQLDEIAQFVGEVCQAPTTDGYRTETELRAAAEAKGKLLTAKIAEANANASAARKTAKWQGIDQQQLAAAMQDSRTCAPKVLEAILPKVDLQTSK
jgi:uncharacterized membrane protein YqiK